MELEMGTESEVIEYKHIACIDGGRHSTYIPPPSEALGWLCLPEKEALTPVESSLTFSYFSLFLHHSGGFERLVVAFEQVRIVHHPSGGFENHQH
jgi:hypothetical protein